MRIEQVMTMDPIFVELDDDVEDAYELMHQHVLAELPVVADGRLVGVIREEALHECLEPESHAPCEPADRSMTEMMCTDVLTCTPSTPLDVVGQMMDETELQTIYAIGDDGRLLGVVSDTDLVDWFGDGEPEPDMTLLHYLPLPPRRRDYSARSMAR